MSADRLTFGKLAAANLVRAMKWHKGGLDEWRQVDWSNATAGEAGELADAVIELNGIALQVCAKVGEICNAVKKLRRIEDSIANVSAEDRRIESIEQAIAKIAGEAADVQIYLDLLAQRCGFSLAQAVIDKYNAVSVKYGFPDRLEP